ncbi:hypothetical protein FOA52_011627 [Chlamydomonas sp. UWO 241]|nr:hypothetical protein FOA52_011627 [Chlamydomonas sp. UWO 241]
MAPSDATYHAAARLFGHACLVEGARALEGALEGAVQGGGEDGGGGRAGAVGAVLEVVAEVAVVVVVAVPGQAAVLPVVVVLPVVLVVVMVVAAVVVNLLVAAGAAVAMVLVTPAPVVLRVVGVVPVPVPVLALVAFVVVAVAAVAEIVGVPRTPSAAGCGCRPQSWPCWAGSCLGMRACGICGSQFRVYREATSQQRAPQPFPYKPGGHLAAAYTAALCVLLPRLRCHPTLERLTLVITRGEYLSIALQGGQLANQHASASLQRLWGRVVSALSALVQARPALRRVDMHTPPNLLPDGAVASLSQAAASGAQETSRAHRALLLLGAAHPRSRQSCLLQLLPQPLLQDVLDDALPRGPPVFGWHLQEWLPGGRSSGSSSSSSGSSASGSDDGGSDGSSSGGGDDNASSSEDGSSSSSSDGEGPVVPYALQGGRGRGGRQHGWGGRGQGRGQGRGAADDSLPPDVQAVMRFAGLN